MAGPGRPRGLPKTGGRVKNSIDREKRKLLSDRMAADLMYCYETLGGREWLLTFARDQPAEFIRQGLSRLFPSPQRDDADQISQSLTINAGNLSEYEVARRIAFILSKGLNSLQPEPVTAERVPSPQESCAVPRRENLVDQPPTGPSLTHEELAELAEKQRKEALEQGEHHGSGAEQDLRKRSLL
ncbi:hypothetical protein D3C78_270850 [compost metagenome]